MIPDLDKVTIRAGVPFTHTKNNNKTMYLEGSDGRGKHRGLREHGEGHLSHLEGGHLASAGWESRAEPD